MYQQHGALHHMDVRSGAAIYRIFLLASTLQVDIAFWPEAEFGAIAPTFRLFFGTAADREPAQAPGTAELIGLGWLYALHARPSIARGRASQAEYMISGVRGEFVFPAPPLIEERVAECAGRYSGGHREPRAMSSTVLRSVSSPRPSMVALLIEGSTSASAVA